MVRFGSGRRAQRGERSVDPRDEALELNSTSRAEAPGFRAKDLFPSTTNNDHEIRNNDRTALHAVSKHELQQKRSSPRRHPTSSISQEKYLEERSSKYSSRMSHHSMSKQENQKQRNSPRGRDSEFLDERNPKSESRGRERETSTRRAKAKAMVRRQKASSSPNKRSKQYPLLDDQKQSKKQVKKLSQVDKLKMRRKLKLRILEDDEKDVPLYTPPVIPDADSDIKSISTDKYSMSENGRAGNRTSKLDPPLVPSEGNKSIPKKNAQFHSQSEVSSTYYSNSSVNSIASESTTTGVAADSETYGQSTEIQSQEQQALSQPEDESHFDNDDEVVNSPRKAAGYSGVVKSYVSSRDVDSSRFIGSNSSEILSGSDEGFILVQQRIAYACIVLTAVHLGILFIQLTLCGVASLKINPLIGPFPDAFSEWGGKNAYLLVQGRQYFRLITPVFLHVGILHFIVNAYCQLETCAYFEREWGSFQWIVVHLISGLGSVLTSSAVEPDMIGVCSSGALMGMFGAKIAQVITWSIFELKNSILEQSIQFDQLGGVMCSAAMVSLLSFFTYIDWSGHMGGLFAGFFTGIIIFAQPIARRRSRYIWACIGLIAMIVGGSITTNLLFLHTEPDEELSDACQYFRNLYPEGYDCECVWD